MIKNAYSLFFVLLVLAYFSTPSWFKSDYLQLMDLLIILIHVVVLILLFLGKRGVYKLSRGLLISMLFIEIVYFLSTAQVVPTDLGSANAFLRFNYLFGTNIQIGVSLGEFLETFNLLLISIYCFTFLIYIFQNRKIVTTH